MTADHMTERARRIVSGAMFGLTTPMMVDAIVSDLADAGLLVSPEHDAAVAAKALRDAADEVYGDERAAGQHWHPLSAASWLRDRAARIEAGESDADA